MFDQIIAAAKEMEAALTELDADTLIGSQPADGLAVLARHERCVAAARLALTTRAEEMRQWHRDGYRSFDEWMAATFGTTPGAAKKQAKTAKNLSDNQRTAKALADGEISEVEADVVADAAAKNPDAEDELLDTARNKNKSHDDLKDKAAKAKTQGESDQARARRLRQGRRAGWSTDRDGFWGLWSKHQPHLGAEMKARLDAEVDRVFAAARARGRAEPLDRYRADALTNLILGRDTHTDPTDHGSGSRRADRDTNQTTRPDRGPAEPATRSAQDNRGSNDAADDHRDQHNRGTTEPQLDLGLDPRSSRTSAAGPANPDLSKPDAAGSDHAGTGRRSPGTAGAPAGAGRVGKELVIDINLQTYRRGTVLSGETCTIRGVGPVPVEIAHQWANDAFIKAVIRDGTDIRTVAHYGRHVPAHIRTALGILDTHCAVPGCSNPRVELDHDQPFAHGGACSTTNLRPLCAHHHRQRTRHGYELTGPPHNRQWTDPTGRVLFTDNPGNVDDADQATRTDQPIRAP